MEKRPYSDIKKWLNAAQTITEALPFMRRYTDKVVLIKYGGHAMGDAKLAEIFAKDIVLLRQIGCHPVVVHGGGPQIGDMLGRLKVKSEFIDGLRVTDATTVEIVEMVLCGTINKQVVTAINRAGGSAVGISGKDGNLIQARKLRRTRKDVESNIEKILDLGFVGEPRHVNPRVLTNMLNTGIIPVIAPIGVGLNGETFNINADTAAGAVASALRAERLLMMTDVPGVLDKEGNLISQISVDELEALRQDGTISGGMIPKLETCVSAVKDGVGAAVILDGRQPHAMLLEIFTDRGIGTLITPANGVV
ncbi:MAG TPA: acetylglutamate kinase [Kiloniellaceae bacterium]|nr:acetylglutamate kinase [Kiloniellaceae bacterium]